MDALSDAESATGLLRAEKSPTMHILDMILASVVSNLRSLANSTQPGTAVHILSSRLLDGILKRRKSHNSDCPMAERFAHVATMLCPAYKVMTHMQHLVPYRETDQVALLTVAKMCAVLTRNFLQGVVSNGLSTDSNANSESVHRLLASGVSAGHGGSPGEGTLSPVVLEE